MADTQTHRYFRGNVHTLSISWHIVNNVGELYDSCLHDGKWGEMPALDGTLLYVWVDLHLTDSDMDRHIQDDFSFSEQFCDDMEIITI